MVFFQPGFQKAKRASFRCAKQNVFKSTDSFFAECLFEDVAQGARDDATKSYYDFCRYVHALLQCGRSEFIFQAAIEMLHVNPMWNEISYYIYRNKR